MRTKFESRIWCATTILSVRDWDVVWLKIYTMMCHVPGDLFFVKQFVILTGKYVAKIVVVCFERGLDKEGITGQTSTIDKFTMPP